MKKLSELLLGEKFTTFVVLHRKEQKQKKNGEPYLLMELGDASHRLPAVMWSNIETATVETGDIVKVAGSVEEYQNHKQVKVERIRQAREDDEVDLTLLIPSTEVDRNVLWQQFQEMIESVAQPFLLSLLRRVFSDEEFAKSFRDTPGGKKWHHAYLGGLLEHTLTVARICDHLAKVYPKADRDLLITAALLHDIGKVESYTHGPVFDYTDSGRLVGHIVIGSQLVSNHIRQFSGFPKDLEMHLQHLILSHQGRLDQASPVEPMTPEGFLLYYADELDSKMNAIQRIRDEEGSEGVRWSKYVNLLDRYLYLGHQKVTPA